MRQSLFIVTVFGFVLCFSHCSSSSSSSPSAMEDTSPSGTVSAAVGGSLNSSDSSGTVAILDRHTLDRHMMQPLLLPFFSESALATNSCPTLTTSNGSGCSSSSNVALLTYSHCNFGTSTASWNGYMQVDFSPASTTLSCGTFPSPVSDTIRRQYVTSGGVAAATVTRTAASGRVVTIDDTTTGIYDNYQGDTFDGSGASGVTFTTFNSGGGSEVTFDSSGKRTGVTVVEHISGATSGGTTLWDHTVAGSVNISETGSGSSKVWTASAGTVTSGSCSSGVTVYHNAVKMMGSTCFENVTYSPTCCTPTAGTIVTTFSKTSASPTNAVTTAMDNKSETLTITGCGTGTLVDYRGDSTSVSLTGCY